MKVPVNNESRIIVLFSILGLVIVGPLIGANDLSSRDLTIVVVISAALIALFSVLGFISIRNRSIIEINETGVTCSSRKNTFVMKWDEIDKIYTILWTSLEENHPNTIVI